MADLIKKAAAFLRADPKRTAVFAVGACLCLAAVILIVGLALADKNVPDAPTVSIPEEAVSTSEWPEADLLGGIPEPDAGEIIAVYQTERTVAVFLEDFPAEELQAYFDKTGLTFKGSSPYVASAEECTVVIAYSATDERLSITVIS